MGVIRVTLPEGKQAEYSEKQLRALWDQGELLEETMYWQSGMIDWRPLSELLGPRGEGGTATTPPTTEVPRYTYTKDPQALTKFLIAMLIISLLVDVVSILGDAAQMALLGRDFTMEEAEANDARQGMIGIGFIAVFLVTAIVFLKCTHRANRNCHGFGAEDMQYTPGWAVGYYFIPILNLVRPYQVMKEIWQVSTDPMNWKSQGGSALLAGWWGLWIINGILGQVTFRLTLNADTIEKLQAATVASIASGVLAIASCIAAIRLIQTISQKQELLVAKGQDDTADYFTASPQ